MIVVKPMAHLAWSGALTCSGTPPVALWGHSCIVYGNYIYVFGGNSTLGVISQKTHRIDLATLAWSGELTCSGTKPSVRLNHTAVVSGNYMYVFGGDNNNSSYYQDTHRLNLNTLEWSGELTTTGTKPLIRCSQSSVVYGNYMYVFGGYRYQSGSIYYQDTHRLDLTTLAWSDELTTTGTKPIARCDHTAVVYDKYMYIFGGDSDPSSTIRQDTHRLDLTTLAWSGELTCSGTKPVIRGDHSAIVCDKYMYVFGGLNHTDYLQDTHRLDLTNLAWSGELTCSGTKPDIRMGHGAVNFDRYMYVFAGLTDPDIGGRFNDLHRLEGLRW